MDDTGLAAWSLSTEFQHLLHHGPYPVVDVVELRLAHEGRSRDDLVFLVHVSFVRRSYGKTSPSKDKRITGVKHPPWPPPLPLSGELTTGVPPTSVSAHGAPVLHCLRSTTGGCSPPDVSAPGRPTPQDPEAPTDLGPTATLEHAKASQFFRSRAKTESSSIASGQPNLGPSLCPSCTPVLITQTPGSRKPGLAPTLTTCAFLGPFQRPRGQPQPYSCQPCRPLRAGGSRNASEEGTFQTDARRVTVLSPAPCGTSCCSSQLRLT